MKPDRLSSVVAISAIAFLSLAFMGAYLVLELNHRPTDGFVTTFAPMLAPTFAALVLLFKQDKTQHSVEQVQAQVESVQEKTNGHMTTLVDAAIHSVPVAELEPEKVT